jgi:hypothetical protein
MFRRILSLSLIYILYTYFILIRCSSLIVSELRKLLVYRRLKRLNSCYIEDRKVELQADRT